MGRGQEEEKGLEPVCVRLVRLIPGIQKSKGGTGKMSVGKKVTILAVGIPFCPTD